MSDEEPKKKGALVIAFGTKKPEGDDEESHDADDEGEKAAADEVWDAIQSKDREAFRSSLRSYVRICSAGHEPDEDDDEDEE